MEMVLIIIPDRSLSWKWSAGHKAGNMLKQELSLSLMEMVLTSPLASLRFQTLVFSNTSCFLEKTHCVFIEHVFTLKKHIVFSLKKHNVFFQSKHMLCVLWCLC